MPKVLPTFCNSVEGKNRNRANILIERSNNAGLHERIKETGVLLEKRKFNRKDLPQWALKATRQKYFS